MHSELNTFFPFDPYRLPRSGSYIEGVYREWASVAIDDNEEDEEEDSDESDDEADNASASEGSEHPGELLIAAIPVNGRSGEDSESDGLGASFGGMSISPARPALSVSLGFTPMSVS